MPAGFVAGNQNHTDTAGTTGAVNAPAGIQVGDVMVLIVGFGSGATITTLSGWTIIGTVVTSGVIKSGAYYKVVVSGDLGATFTWTFTGTTTSSVFAVAAYRGCTTFDSAAEAASTTAQAVTGPSTTAVSANNMMIYTRTTRDDTTTTSNAQNTTAAGGVSGVRAQDVATVAGVAVHGATIWDNVTSVGSGTRTGISTSSTTASPTNCVSRTISLKIADYPRSAKRRKCTDAAVSRAANW